MPNPEKNIKAPDGKKAESPPDIKLPFEKKKHEPGEWVFEHRTSIFITVVIYLLLAISFVFSKVVVDRVQARNTIVFDIEDLNEMEELQKELERARQLNRELSPANDYFDDVRNAVSNENARVEELNRDDRQVQDLLHESRRQYEQASEQLRLMEEAARERSDDQVRQDVKVEGRVTVSFSLRNPTRTASYLFVPAYKCESGGTVVVNITVNRNGDVTAATVDRSLSSSDHCMTTTAVQAALRSRFGVHATAPVKHTGTITYIFVPQ